MRSLVPQKSVLPGPDFFNCWNPQTLRLFGTSHRRPQSQSAVRQRNRRMINRSTPNQSSQIRSTTTTTTTTTTRTTTTFEEGFGVWRQTSWQDSSKLFMLALSIQKSNPSECPRFWGTWVCHCGMLPGHGTFGS